MAQRDPGNGWKSLQMGEWSDASATGLSGSQAMLQWLCVKYHTLMKIYHHKMNALTTERH